jgi:hypothetical protein
VADYRGYLKALPDKERSRVNENAVWFFQDEAGQHAVKIEIPLNGIWWQHCLMYDRNNIRIRAIKYKSGGYRS